MNKLIIFSLLIASCGQPPKPTPSSLKIDSAILRQHDSVVAKESTEIKRYFLIGYIATTGDGDVFDGGIDTVMKHYPNINQSAAWIQAKFATYKLHDLRILAITEMSKVDYDAFWKGFNGAK